MAATGIRTGTEGLAALKSRWEAAYRAAPNEEALIIGDFDKPEGVERLDNKLYIRIVPVVTPIQIASSAHGSDGNGYQTASITSVYAEPSFYGAIVQLPDNLKSNLGNPDFAQLEAVYRKQGLAALNSQFDGIGAQLALSVSTLKGPGNFDQTSLLDAINAVVTNAKEHVQIGTTRILVKYHPSQWKHLLAINVINQAYSRGDKANPLVKGLLVDALGAKFTETGNIAFSGGFYHNLIHAPQAFVWAWNLMPMVKPTQDFEFSKRIVLEGEGGGCEVFDADAVTYRTA